MGAALLKNPDNLVAILSLLVEEVGKPNNVPISVKIRILETPEATLDLIRRLCATGVARITVHCRTTPMRPREPAIRDQLPDIIKVCHEAGVQCYMNGDVEDRAHAENLIEEFGVDGCMIARAAETNPSCFRSEGPLPWMEVAQEYLKTAIETGNHVSNTKFCLVHHIPGKIPLYTTVTQCKTIEAMCNALELPYTPSEEDEVPVRIVPKAVQKAQKVSKAAKAAGGHTGRSRSGKKLNERGVSANSAPIPAPDLQSEPQTMSAAL